MGFSLTGALRCGTCGKRYANPLTHTCSSPRGDFKARRRRAATVERRRKRKAAAERRKARRKQAAADRRARERARKAAAKKARSPRPRARSGDAHEPGTCGNRDCPKYGCKAYWAGMDDCPGGHGGEDD